MYSFKDFGYISSYETGFDLKSYTPQEFGEMLQSFFEDMYIIRFIVADGELTVLHYDLGNDTLVRVSTYCINYFKDE